MSEDNGSYVAPSPSSEQGAHFTPGPWEVGGYVDAMGQPIYSESETICYVQTPLPSGNARREANAALITAAPALYGALQFILAFYEPGQRYLDTEAWKVAEASARAAMRKARGDVEQATRLANAAAREEP